MNPLKQINLNISRKFIDSNKVSILHKIIIVVVNLQKDF